VRRNLPAKPCSCGVPHRAQDEHEHFKRATPAGGLGLDSVPGIPRTRRGESPCTGPTFPSVPRAKLQVSRGGWRWRRLARLQDRVRPGAGRATIRPWHSPKTGPCTLFPIEAQARLLVCTPAAFSLVSGPPSLQVVRPPVCSDVIPVARHQIRGLYEYSNNDGRFCRQALGVERVASRRKRLEDGHDGLTSPREGENGHVTSKR